MQMQRVQKLFLIQAAGTLFAALAGQAYARAACPILPPPVLEIQSASIYGSGTSLGAHIDEGSSAERERLTKPVNDYVREVATLAQDAVDLRSKDSAECALAGLRAWAMAGALTGPPATEAARKDLIWNTAGLSLAYLRVRTYASPEQSAAIERWLRTLATWVLDHYGNPRRQDNVFAWTGLVAASFAAVSGDSRFWGEAVRIHELMLKQVNEAGHLPNELERRSRALAYHNFALVPLVVTDRLRQRNGRPTSPEGLDAIRRLEAFTRGAMQDPKRIEDLAQAKQEEPGRRNFVCWTDIRSSPQPAQPVGNGTTSAPSVGARAQFERWLGGYCSYFAN